MATTSLPPPDLVGSQLQRYYESRCAAAVKRGSSLIVAIPKGQSPDCVAINLELTKQAMLNQGAAAYVEAIDQLFAGDLILTPCMESYTLDQEDRMPVIERVLRHGYARDRVMGVNKVKKSMLNQGKVGATAEYLLKQQHTLEFISKWYAQFESALLKQASLSKPSDAIALKRQQWKAQVEGEVDPDGLFNQVTMTQGTPLHGTSRLLCEALAADPLMQSDYTPAYARQEILNQPMRDFDIGTETFVAFTFPPEEHALMVAAASVNGGIAKMAGSYAFPAHVTYHSSTGEATALATGVGSAPGPNSLFTGDAALLMTTLHALANEARRDFVVMEHL